MTSDCNENASHHPSDDSADVTYRMHEPHDADTSGVGPHVSRTRAAGSPEVGDEPQQRQRAKPETSVLSPADSTTASPLEGGSTSESSTSPSPVRWDDFSDLVAPANRSELEVSIAFGRIGIRRDELGQLQPGTVVPLDDGAKDAVNIHVAGQLVAQGEVLVADGKYCVRVTRRLT